MSINKNKNRGKFNNSSLPDKDHFSKSRKSHKSNYGNHYTNINQGMERPFLEGMRQLNQNTSEMYRQMRNMLINSNYSQQVQNYQPLQLPQQPISQPLQQIQPMPQPLQLQSFPAYHPIPPV